VPVLAAMAMAAGLTIASVALAAGQPAATTDAASNVTATSATLNATVFPNQNSTTYYFQYGPTAGYGAQTPTQGPVSGNAGKSASADVTGLVPATTYHFRVVATNSAGTSNGSDVTFTTAAAGTTPTKPPPVVANTATISPSPATLTFGSATTISGQVTGPGNAGVSVTLEQNPFPYSGGFKSTALTTTTNATGAYSFVVKPLVNTAYRVTAKTKPPVTSPQAAVTVRVKVTFRLSTLKPARGQRVRFSGTVTPAHNGKLARIQKRTSTGAWKTVASATLVAAPPVNGVAVSKFSKRLRISRTATYRVQVNPGDGDHALGNSPSHRVRVH
jgi:hypothetical protein